MKTKIIITLSVDDYEQLLYSLGRGTGQSLRAGDEDQAAKFKSLFVKISESVTFTQDHEKPKC